MIRSKPALVLAAAFAVASSASLHACIHMPRTYKGTVSEKTKEALLFHDGVNAHLIIKTNLQASSGSLPDTMAWVIPLPSLPSHYEEANAAIFKEMFDAIEAANQKREAIASHGVETTAIMSPAASSIEIHPIQIVGSYQIQPIEILDLKNAGGELNHWLIGNGFGRVPVENQRYYLKKGAVFLALKVHGLRGNFSDIKPLHIVYRANTLTLPLKFSTHSGVFDVDMYAFTPGPLDTALLGADNLQADPSVEIGAADDAPLLWQTVGQKHGFLTRFEGKGFNLPGLAVKDQPSDPAIDLSKDNSPSDHTEPTDYRLLGRVGMAALLLLMLFAIWRRRLPPNPSQTRAGFFSRKA